MKISEAKKGLRVRLTPKVKARYTLDIDVQIDLRRAMLIPRDLGTLRSGRVLTAHKVGEEEGAFVVVMWDGLRSPEKWHLTELDVAPEEEKQQP